MAASDFLQKIPQAKISTQITGMGASKFLNPTTAKSDVETVEGIQQFASNKDIELPKPKKKSGILGGISKVADVLRTGEFAVGGLLAGKSPIAGIKEKISPSDVLFKGVAPTSRLGKIGVGIAKFGTDVLLDPTTYLTLGTGAALKVTTKAGAKVAISKAGKDMLEELAGEIVEKSGGKLSKNLAIKEARQQVAELATKTTAKSTLERGGLGNIMKALEKSGVAPTREAVEKATKEGVEGLRAKTGLKFFGKELVAGKTLTKPFAAIDTALRKTSAGKELVEGVEKISGAFGKMFGRDFGLPNAFKVAKQKFIDSFDNSTGRIKNSIKTVFSGTTKIDRESITTAMEGGIEGIAKLPEHLRPVAQRVKKIFEQIATEEEKRGLLNSTLDDYVTHIYKNQERAKTLLGEMRKGQPSAILKFAKERSIPTLEEAEKLGLEPIKDIAEILNVRLMASEKAKLTQDFFGKVAGRFGVSETIGITKRLQIPARFKDFITKTKIFSDDVIEKGIELEVLEQTIKEHPANALTKYMSKTTGTLPEVTGKATMQSLTGSGKIIPTSEFGKRGDQLVTKLGFASEREATEAFEQLQELRKLRDEFKKTIKLAVPTTEITKATIAVKPAEEVILNIKKSNPEYARRILEMGENFTRFSDVATGIPNHYKDLQIPTTIANDIARMGKKFFDDEAANTLLRGYDKALNFFKGSVTVLFPSFHGRNAVSNTILNFMDIGVQAFNPQRWKQAVDVMLGKEGKFITELGEEYSYQTVRKLMREHQVFQDKLARTDVGRVLETNVLKRQGVFGAGRTVGRAIENEGRLINFMTNLRRGFSPEDAATRTKEFLFDYDNLSNFEKEAMRRLIPFFTFTRKNIALQLKTLITNPSKVVNQARALEAIGEAMGTKMTDEEKEFAPEYVKQGLFTLLQRKGDDRTFLIGFDLPFEDAFEKLNKPIKSALSMLTPFLKPFAEIGTGRNFFTEKNIKDDDSGNFAKNLPKPVQEWLDYSAKTITKKDGTTFVLQKADPTRKWIFQNVVAMTGVGRISGQRTLTQLAAFHKALKGDKMTLEERYDMVSFFTGIKAVTRSLEQEKQYQEKQEARELQDVLERKGEIRRYENVYIPKENKPTATPKGASRFLN